MAIGVITFTMEALAKILIVHNKLPTIYLSHSLFFHFAMYYISLNVCLHCPWLKFRQGKSLCIGEIQFLIEVFDLDMAVCNSAKWIGGGGGSSF